MRIVLARLLATLMVTEATRVNTRTISKINSGSTKKPTKKLGGKNNKGHKNYSSTKPIKSKATKVFRNKNNI